MQATHTDPAQVQAMMMAMVPFILFGMLVVWAIVIIPFWQIFRKAGFTPALSLLMILPLVNVIMLYVVAFSQWRVVPAGPDYPPYPAYPPVPPPGYVPSAACTPSPVYPPQAGYPPPPPPPPSGPESV